MCFLPDKWLQHFSATGRRVRSVWISGKPKNVTSQTPAGLSFELWSLTEEKVGFSGTLSDGPAKKGRDWEKPGGYYGRKALCMCLCVSVCMRGREKRNKGRGWGSKWHRICSFSNSFLLPHRHQVISFLATVGYKAFLNVIQRGMWRAKTRLRSPGAFAGSTVSETGGDRFPDKRGTMAVTWHN